MNFLKNHFRRLLSHLFICLFGMMILGTHAQSNSAESSASSTIFASKEQALDFFLIEISMRENLSIELLRDAFRDLKWQSLARQYMVPSSSSPPRKNWSAYRANVMSQLRIDAGKKFLQEHRVFLDQLEKEFGVPRAVIVGILGVETNYGRYMGSFPVRDVLATFAFDYPPSANQASRSAMFKEQLYDHVLNCIPSTSLLIDANILRNCLVQEGSFAGAMGMPQFMPTSIRKYAKDGDGNGMIDLRKSPQDAMQSIANFLKGHGWKSGEPIYLPIPSDMQQSAIVKELADGDPVPKHTLGELKNKQVVTQWPSSINENSPALIVDLPSIGTGGNTTVEYVVGLKNFEVITFYNRSFFYAMSVTELGNAIINNSIAQTKYTKPEKRPSTNNDRRDHKR
jgi:membrane-bound lytic murein transglycosylase B